MFSSEESLPILPSVTLHINRKSLSLSLFTYTNFSPTNSLHILFIFFTVFFIFFIFFLRPSSQTNLKPLQQWPAHMNLTPTQRKPPHPRNRNPKQANLGIRTLGNLGNPMNTMKNTMNAKNILGRPKGRVSKSRNSLDILGESKNSLGRLSMKKQKPRGKGRRRFNSSRSLLPKDRGLRRMTL